VFTSLWAIAWDGGVRSQSLTFRRCPNIDDTLLSRVFGGAKAKTLEQLMLTDCTQLTDMAIVGLTNDVIKLHAFSVGILNEVRVRQRRLPLVCSPLVCDVRDDVRAVGYGAQEKASLPYLLHLDFSGYIALTNKGLSFAVEV
jgi:hypothetical protein